MATKLKGKDPALAQHGKPKILVFGAPGVGKTWAALDFPNAYYIDTEGGANLPQYTKKLIKSNGRYVGVEDGIKDLNEVIDQVKALATEKHEFKTVVIDSLSEIMLNRIADQSDKMMAAGTDMTKTFGAEKKPAVSLCRILVSWLQRLDMNVILICHEKAEWDKDKRIGETFDAGWDKLEYILHLTLRITKQGTSRKAFVRKTRLEGFQDGLTFDWSYSEFAKLYGKDVIEGVVKQIVLATKEQLTEYRYLVGIIKLPDGQEKKWLEIGECDNFEDMETSKIQAIINVLKSKITTKPEEK